MSAGAVREAGAYAECVLCRILYAVLVLIALWHSPASAATRCRALDGDTVQCGNERVRLREVYAAERGSPGADQERRAATQARAARAGTSRRGESRARSPSRARRGPRPSGRRRRCAQVCDAWRDHGASMPRAAPPPSPA